LSGHAISGGVRDWGRRSGLPDFRSGAAMAIVMISTDFGYALRRWNGKKWLKQ